MDSFIAIVCQPKGLKLLINELCSLVVAILSLWYCASNGKNDEVRFAENELAIFKESMKILNNPALTEGSMSRALVHKCAQTSIDKFYYYVTSNARFTKKRRCYQSVICKLWSEGAIAREYRQIVDLDSTDTGAYLLKHCLLAECLWGLSHVCSWWKSIQVL